MTEKYNGWTNYETWAWKLWIDNDQGWQEYWLEQTTELIESEDDPVFTLRNMLEEEAEEMATDFIGHASGPMADLLRSAVQRIDYYEIAAALIEDAADIAA